VAKKDKKEEENFVLSAKNAKFAAAKEIKESNEKKKSSNEQEQLKRK